MSEENKDFLKHVLISIFIGAAIAFLDSLTHSLENILKDPSFHIASPLAGMIWFIKGRRPLA
jgi:hypothetical protein